MKLFKYKIIKSDKGTKYTAFITDGKKPIVYLFDGVYFYDKDDNECGPEYFLGQDDKIFKQDSFWDGLYTKLPLSVFKEIVKL